MSSTIPFSVSEMRYSIFPTHIHSFGLPEHLPQGARQALPKLCLLQCSNHPRQKSLPHLTPVSTYLKLSICYFGILSWQYINPISPTKVQMYQGFNNKSHGLKAHIHGFKIYYSYYVQRRYQHADMSDMTRRGSITENLTTSCFHLHDPISSFQKQILCNS